MSQSVFDIAASWNPPSVKMEVKPKTKGNNYTALYWWLDVPEFTQPKRIKSGQLIQAFIEAMVIAAPHSAIIIPGTEMVKVAGGDMKEADIRFILSGKTIIHYREVKCNVNLDSEKLPAVKAKIASIATALQRQYSKHSVDSGMLCPAWLDSDASKGIEGLNDFATILGYDRMTPSEFNDLGKALGNKIRLLLN